MAGKKLVVGLGNPGREYQKTRHNLGFMLVEHMAGLYTTGFTRYRHAQSLVAEAEVEGQDVLFALPLTYMNLSGHALRGIADYERIGLPDILIVTDDIRLAFGAVRLKSGGTHGGHNGIRSVIEQLGTTEVARLRMGIGQPAAPDRQVDYVLSDFTKEEIARMGAFIDDAAGCLRLWIAGQAAEAMTKFNKRKVDD